MQVQMKLLSNPQLRCEHKWVSARTFFGLEKAVHPYVYESVCSCCGTLKTYDGWLHYNVYNETYDDESPE